MAGSRVAQAAQEVGAMGGTNGKEGGAPFCLLVQPSNFEAKLLGSANLLLAFEVSPNSEVEFESDVARLLADCSCGFSPSSS